DVLDGAGGVPPGGVAGEHLLQERRSLDDLIGEREEIVVELLLAGNQAERSHGAPSFFLRGPGILAEELPRALIPAGAPPMAARGGPLAGGDGTLTPYRVPQKS